MHQAVLSECYCIDDPGSSLTELRLFGELLAKNIAARFGIYTDSQSQQQEMLKDLKHRDAPGSKLADLFNNIRIAGNGKKYRLTI